MACTKSTTISIRAVRAGVYLGSNNINYLNRSGDLHSPAERGSREARVERGQGDKGSPRPPGPQGPPAGQWHHGCQCHDSSNFFSYMFGFLYFFPQFLPFGLVCVFGGVSVMDFFFFFFG